MHPAPRNISLTARAAGLTFVQTPLATLPFAVFAAIVTFGTITLGFAVVSLADRTARRNPSTTWSWNTRDSGAEKVGACAARAQFWLGVLWLVYVELAVWAVLEANEEVVPIKLPPSNDCVPCHVFIPTYCGLQIYAESFRIFLLKMQKEWRIAPEKR